ncbi:dsDNA nuclease domain-containing protein [Bacillus paranthracis]|uniref:dsDNA nuclease domain-containing protein n=1 Tax=Bacillus paranthracis TaxID=2026186 RepID=UPI000278FBA1|nr:dsDNA nuclease domain-containing protein [Bacillus paranthracis]EJQ03971.1 hypothetical protein IC5_02769 [Bacillus cereus AND1407]MDG0908940.1 dsDNA nuclease domain-containing protein [Bacillus paranthracis]MDR4347245.1 DUF4297 domain-containing protein [Bacillus paranthracis]TKC26070.1 DUF4297 domain-containing protein [Bacillus paranthracis]HDR7456224.1 DUF4297 domain-containing protein [Bacillus paranthracis]
MKKNIQPEISEVKLKQRIEQFSEDNEESFSEDEKQQLMDSILNGKIPDFSGVTAIRGFLYQYYVTAKYVIDMVYLKSAWWDKVTFELLDDISLHGNGKIRFVQVKTKRESDVVNSLIPSELYERKNKKGSWLDKLFLRNTHIPDYGESKMVLDKDLVLTNDLQFELATNVQYHEKIAIYEKNDAFLNKRKDKEYSVLVNALEEDNLKWGVKHEGVDMVFDNSFYKNSERSLTLWYLKKFRIRRYGNLFSLRKELIDSIASYTEGTSNPFYEYKATIILENLLIEIITRTCRDDEEISLGNFQFDKEELRKKFEGWCESAKAIANADSERNNLRGEFRECFEKIKSDIEHAKWKSSLDQELMDTLTHIQDYLDEQSRYSGKDPFIYQRFLQRLFHMRNAQSRVPLNRIDDTPCLYRSLKCFIYILVFYREISYTSKNARLLFKSVLDGENIWETFMMYNVRQKEDMVFAMKSVRLSSLNCSFSKDLNHDYYCFVADAKPEISGGLTLNIGNQIDSVNVSVVESAIEDKEREKKIIEQTENIKFVSAEFIEQFFELLRASTAFSFKEQNIVNEWRRNLEIVRKK